MVKDMTVILLLMFGCAVAVTHNDLIVDAGSLSNSPVQQSKGPGALQKLENWYYSYICTSWSFAPSWFGSLPLKIRFLRQRIVKVGPAPSCLRLMLSLEYKFPSRQELKKLRESKIPIIWIVGGPGSGKGTFSKMMQDSEGYTHISVGDVIRAEVADRPDAFTSHLIQDVMKQGQLLPDSFTLTVLARKMVSVVDNSNGFLIDGFPRSLKQAKSFQKMIKAPDTIIELKVSDDILKQRVLNRNEGRTDDNEETFQKRLDVYHEQSESVTTNKMFVNKVRKVNAEGEKEDNFRSFSQAIHDSIKTKTN